MDIKTFTTCCGTYRLTVYDIFFKRCNVNMYDGHDLFYNFSIHEYLHNPSGPAIVNLKTGHKSYFLEGRPCTDEEAGKIKIYDKVDSIVKDLLAD